MLLAFRDPLQSRQIADTYGHAINIDGTGTNQFCQAARDIHTDGAQQGCELFFGETSSGKPNSTGHPKITHAKKNTLALVSLTRWSEFYGKPIRCRSPNHHIPCAFIT